MTDAAELNTEQLSQLIAAQGREALMERLRAAYTEAAAAHADIVSLDEHRIEALVQNAADNADGLQWRRALAGVASKELGVSVAEALSHPAVIRAQTELGAPSYEQSLTELITSPVPPPLPAVPEPVASQAAPAVSVDEPAHSDARAPVDEADDDAAAAPHEAVAPSAPAAPVDAQEWEDEPDVEPVPLIDGQLELAPEPPASELAAEPEFPPAAPESSSEPEAGDHTDQPSAFEHVRAPVPMSDDSISEELEVIEADDTMVELLPEPDPIELDTQLYETIPLEADVVEDEERAAEPDAVVEPPAVVEPLPPVPVTPPPDGFVPRVVEPEPETEPSSPASSPEVEAPAEPVLPEPQREPGVMPASTYAAQAEPGHSTPTPSWGPPPAPNPPTTESPAYVGQPPAPEPESDGFVEQSAPEQLPAPEQEPALESAGGQAASAPEVEAERQPVEELRINAIHLGGVANLPTNREGLDLRISSDGLDIMRGEDEIIGRLIWDEIEALEVPNQRRRRRNHQPALARLVVRTRHGDASFEVPGYSSDELRDRVDLRLESYARH
jgi:hypothetical protein